MENVSGSIRQIAEAACADDPESEDENEEMCPKIKAKLEKKRMKELLKASGLKKAEVWL